MKALLLYVHSKRVRSCSMRIQNMAGAALFSHIGAKSNTTGLHDVKSSSRYILNAQGADQDMLRAAIRKF
jgi:hypothetical protein